MLSNKAADKIFERLYIKCNEEITPEKISRLTDEEIKSIGTSNSKVQYIRCLTETVISNDIDFQALKNKPDIEVQKDLMSIRGIGAWSAIMYLIFAWDRQDVLPYEDVAFLQVYKWLYKTDDITRYSIEKKCNKWRPYRSIAARFFYRALDSGFTKEEFHLYK